MSAKVLQMVSSAFFVSAVPTHTVQAAVARLGFDAIRNLVLAIEVFQAHSGRIGAKALERHQTHSLEVARLAASCFDDRKQAARAFTAGMLHDIGELIMAAAMPNTWRRLRNEAPTEAARYDLEQQLTRSTHAQLGAYLLGLWGVYDDVVGAVAHHHRPSAEASINPLTVAVHLAETFAQCRTADRTMAALDPGLADDERARELVGSMIHKMTHLLEAA